MSGQGRKKTAMPWQVVSWVWLHRCLLSDCSWTNSDILCTVHAYIMFCHKGRLHKTAYKPTFYHPPRHKNRPCWGPGLSKYSCLSASVCCEAPSGRKSRAPSCLSSPWTCQALEGREGPAIPSKVWPWEAEASLPVRSPIFSGCGRRQEAWEGEVGWGDLVSGVRDREPFWSSHWSSALRQLACLMWP